MAEESNGSDRSEEQEDASRTEGIRGGINKGLGMLSAMKDALEETLKEARERGDLSPERAKEVMRSTLAKAQSKAGEAREAFDFVTQKEFDGLRSVVDGLKARVSQVERAVGLGKDEAEVSAEETKEPEDG